MKSIVAILLVHLMLGSSLLPGFDLDQSTRWVELAKHYQQHRSDDESLGFLSFLMMHYDASSDHQKAPCHNHNLPAADHCLSLFAPTFLRLDAVAACFSVIQAKKPLFSGRQIFTPSPRSGR